MKKILLLIVLVLALLTGCASKEIKIYVDGEISLFNEQLTTLKDGKTKAYDLRSYSEFYKGRIPGFFSVHTQDDERSMDEVVQNIILVLGSKKNTRIILIDSNGEDSRYVSKKLFAEGYTNIHIFVSGYDRYAELNTDFVPETGECEC